LGSFANPAVAIARALTDTFAGIRPIDAPGFILDQIAAAFLALPSLRATQHPADGVVLRSENQANVGSLDEL